MINLINLRALLTCNVNVNHEEIYCIVKSVRRVMALLHYWKKAIMVV